MGMIYLYFEILKLTLALPFVLKVSCCYWWFWMVFNAFANCKASFLYAGYITKYTAHLHFAWYITKYTTHFNKFLTLPGLSQRKVERIFHYPCYIKTSYPQKVKEALGFRIRIRFSNFSGSGFQISFNPDPAL